MRALGYFRVEEDDDSLQALERSFADYCYLNLHQPVKTFSDLIEPGGDAPARFESLLSYVRESGSSFLVVVPDASHLGHDLEAVARAVVKLERAGVKVVCIEEELPDPFQNALRTLGVKGVSQIRSNRIKESMRARALGGQVLGRPAFGYRHGPDGTPEVVPEEARVVELIYNLYTEQDVGLRLIAQHLNERGIPTRRGGNWSLVSIRDILRNPTYTGTYSRFGLRLPRNHEAIVSPALFREAQDTMTSRRPSRRATDDEPFLLTGLIFCGYCGNRMMGATRRQMWRLKDGRRARGVYRYYQCQSRANQGRCSYHTWRSSDLESTVKKELAGALQSGPPQPKGDAAGGGDHPAEAARDSRIALAERRLVRIMRRIALGELGTEALARHLDQLDSLRDVPPDTVEPIDGEKVPSDWDGLTAEQARRLLERHIRRIVVKDDSVEVLA